MSDPDSPSTDTDTADRSAAAADAEPASRADAGARADAPTGSDSASQSRSEAEALRVAVETDVPPGAPVHACERCGRPFAREERLVLHRGLAHYGDLTDAERDAFAAAYDDERADIHRFRIVALGGLVLLYFGFLLAYALVT